MRLLSMEHQLCPDGTGLRGAGWLRECSTIGPSNLLHWRQRKLPRPGTEPRGLQIFSLTLPQLSYRGPVFCHPNVYYNTAPSISRSPADSAPCSTSAHASLHEALPAKRGVACVAQFCKRAIPDHTKRTRMPVGQDHARTEWHLRPLGHALAAYLYHW